MTYKVGLRRRPYLDMARMNWEGTAPRLLLTDIWYPAAEGANETDIFLGPPDEPLFKAGRAARDAEIETAVFPLILLSHGTGGAALQLGWLASFLAAQGYIVAGVNHHGNTALEPYTAEGFVRVWERARDLTALLDQLLEDDLFGPHIDRQRIGAAGFSLGGYTVIALAGGVLDGLGAVYQDSERDLMDDMPPEFPDPAVLVEQFKAILESDTEHQQSYRDERIRCVFAIAPAIGEGFTPAGLAPVDIPIRIMVGEADRIAPAATNANRYASMIETAELTTLEQVAHYTFLGEGTELGKQVAPELCLDPPEVDRAAIHRQVSELAKEFFNDYLLAKQSQ